MEKNYQRIIAGPARLSYPNLFTPKAGQPGQEPKYSCELLIPKTDTAAVASIRAAIQGAIPANAPRQANGKLMPNFRIPLRDGDVERNDDTHKGMWFINCSSRRRPTAVRKTAGVYTQLAEEDLYGGCWVYAELCFFPYSISGNQGVGAGLNSVLKFRDDKPFGGGGSDPETAFASAPDTAPAAVEPVATAPADDMPDFGANPW